MSLRVFGASVRGPDHEREDTSCQDAWAFVQTGERAAALCLCDGAGSATHAEIGAQTVVAAVVDALREFAPESPAALVDALCDACAHGRAVLLREAATRALTPADMACTLVAVLAWGSHVAVAHIGDGAVIGRMRASGELTVLSAPERGEFANETWFISSASWRERMRVGLHEGLDVVCALTDGCQSAAMQAGLTAFAPFCGPLFDFATEITDAAFGCTEVAKLLDAEPLRRSSGDDKTLAVAVLSA